MIPQHAPKTTLIERRRLLSQKLGGETILLYGHRPLPRNFVANSYPFRQDSSFLYYGGLSLPGCALRIEKGGHTTLFAPPPVPSDALWHGESPSLAELCEQVGADAVRPAQELSEEGCHVLPIADPSQEVAAPSAALIAAVIEQRLCRDDYEIAAMRRSVEVTSRAHRAAMAATRPGLRDVEIQALIEQVFGAAGMTSAYPSIVTTRGEVLHGHAEGRTLEAGDLLLVDAGAEEPGGYAADVTRTWPVSGRFTARQRAVYDAVLAAQQSSIALCRSGVRYQDVHLASARVLAQFALDEGLFRGELDGLVAAGAHAVLFPHGVGHLIGLDVHDMELYGDAVGYPEGRSRSAQFGLSFLRLDRDLQPGMVVTIEPGIYLVPTILKDAALRERLGDSVDWDRLASWVPFGGVRIEDDILVTEGAPDVLSADTPNGATELEALVGTTPLLS